MDMSRFRRSKERYCLHILLSLFSLTIINKILQLYGIYYILELYQKFTNLIKHYSLCQCSKYTILFFNIFFIIQFSHLNIYKLMNINIKKKKKKNFFFLEYIKYVM